MPIVIADRIGLNFTGVYINSYKYDFSQFGELIDLPSGWSKRLIYFPCSKLISLNLLSTYLNINFFKLTKLFTLR